MHTHHKGSIIVTRVAGGVTFKKPRPGERATPSISAPGTVSEWPSEYTAFLEDPSNKLSVANKIGVDTVVLSVPHGQEEMWVERFGAIAGISASLNEAVSELKRA